MTRTLLVLGCVATLAPGCVTDADLRFLGMDDRPRDTVVEATRQPLILGVERPTGAAATPDATGGPLAPVPGPDAAPMDATGFWNSPWVRPLHFGLPSDPADARWSVTGAGRGPMGLPGDDPRDAAWSVAGAARAPLGLPAEPGPERLTFADDDPPPKAATTPAPKPGK